MLLNIATFNLCNLGADVSPKRLARLATIIKYDLAEPDILALQEIKAFALPQSQVVPADPAYQCLRKAVVAAGGPHYDFREVPPPPNQSGGHPNFNIRSGFMFNPDRVQFVDTGPGGLPEDTKIRLRNGCLSLTSSPGYIASGHPAFNGDGRRHWLPSRKVLVAEFRLQNRQLLVVACHLKSMRAATRREQAYAKKQRHAQADVINQFVRSVLACNAQARIVVLGDMNDSCQSKTLKLLQGRHLDNAFERLPKALRYTCRRGTKPRALDHILLSRALQKGASVCVPHVNSDAPEIDRVSDHDPVLVTIEVS